MSALAWLTAHGTRDDLLSTAELIETAKRRTLSVTCGTVSHLAAFIARRAGVQARVVATRARTLLNGYDDGHILLEVLQSGRWVVYDLDANAMFLSTDGVPMSLLELSEAVRWCTYAIERLGAQPGVDIGHFRMDDYDLNFYATYMFGTQEQLRKWYDRILIVPILIDGDGYWTSSELVADQEVENVQAVGREALVKRFYRP